MPHSIFGWDLPPGCRVSDIPGNRPEDAKWEAIEENFYDKERLLNPKYGIRISEKEYALMDEICDNPKYSDVVTTYISAAIEYGMNLGQKEERYNTEQNRHYESEHIQDILEKSKVNSEVVKKVMDILGGKYETS